MSVCHFVGFPMNPEFSSCKSTESTSGRWFKTTFSSSASIYRPFLYPQASLRPVASSFTGLNLDCSQNRSQNLQPQRDPKGGPKLAREQAARMPKWYQDETKEPVGALKPPDPKDQLSGKPVACHSGLLCLELHWGTEWPMILGNLAFQAAPKSMVA